MKRINYNGIVYINGIYVWQCQIFALSVEEWSNWYNEPNRWSETKLWLRYIFIEWFTDDVMEQVNSESAHAPIVEAAMSSLDAEGLVVLTFRTKGL